MDSPALPLDQAAIDARSRQLAEEGARLLASRWDEAAAMCLGAPHEHAAGHDPRGTLAYAGVLFAAGDSERARRAVRAVLAMQERTRAHAHLGNFRWMLEEETVRDLNAVEFLLDGLADLLRDHEPAMGGALASEVREAMRLGLAEIDRLDVHPSYTNIFLSDACNRALCGQAIGDARVVTRGAERVDAWLAFTARSGAPHEYNSPTYLAVDIERMAKLAEHGAGAALRARALVAEQLLWRHAAAHWHPPTAQLVGPHSRSYFDGWTGAPGFLKLILWKLLGDDLLRAPSPYAARGREEGHLGIARGRFHPPADAIGLLQEKAYPYEHIDVADAVRGQRLTTYMTRDYALGTASRAFTVGEPPEPWPGPNSLLLHVRREGAPGFAVLHLRYVVDDHDHGGHEELIDEGTFVGAQVRNRALCAYGLQPRLRPMRSAKLSLRMLGAGDGVLIGGRRAGALPAAVRPGEAVTIDAGAAYVALVPLAPTEMGTGAGIELRRTGYLLALDVYNYRGPAKQFWEYRSLGGPFFKTNIRAACAVEVASREDFPGLEAFAAHIAATPLRDVGDGAVRTIRYGGVADAVTLRYDLRTMEPAPS